MTYVDLSNKTKEEVLEYSKRPPAFDPPARLLIIQGIFDELINENQFEVVAGFNYLRDYPVTTSSENQIPQKPKTPKSLDQVKAIKIAEFKIEIKFYLDQSASDIERESYMSQLMEIVVLEMAGESIDQAKKATLKARVSWGNNLKNLFDQKQAEIEACQTVEVVEAVTLSIPSYPG